METKHPKRKEPIKPLTEEQLGAVWKGLDRKRFMEELGRLKYNTAPGLGGLRNEHITALKLNPRRIMTPSASVLLDHYYAYSVAVMKVDLPLWFYEVESTVRLVPANKVDPKELPPNMTPDARPVGVGTAE